MRFEFFNSVCAKESNDMWIVLIWFYLHRNRLSDLSLIEFENGSATATKSMYRFERLSPSATCRRDTSLQRQKYVHSNTGVGSGYPFFGFTRNTRIPDSGTGTKNQTRTRSGMGTGPTGTNSKPVPDTVPVPPEQPRNRTRTRYTRNRSRFMIFTEELKKFMEKMYVLRFDFPLFSKFFHIP